MMKALIQIQTLFCLLLGIVNALSPTVLQNKRILVVGGSGRVGGSCVTQLVQRGARVDVGGTSLERMQDSQERWKSLFPSFADEFSQVQFIQVDREQGSSFSSSLKQDYDLVIHTAGPFQGKVKTPNGVLEACVEQGVPYVDVCDDYCTASAAKTKYQAKAIESQTPCIVSTGCWPGVSSLMAKQLITTIRKQHPGVSLEDMKVDFNFFTAGSGGAGVTLLVATFLILAEQALVIQKGRRREVPAMQDYSLVDFGSVIGEKEVAHLNLLETASAADCLGVGSIQSKFGTAPNFWNALLGVMAKLPSNLLANEDLMYKLSIFSLPIVRIVDAFAGATNAMRCDVTCESKPEIRATATYGHPNLEPCVGECVTAFATAVLSGEVAPGVWFPEQAIDSPELVSGVLEMASVGAHTTTVDSSDGVKLEPDFVWGRRELSTIAL